ncbi:subclass B3 metallo-beta-lactamase [Dyadobacter psychrotolerans]|uniref:subclass B3 metallo-beta-lactamase n=1 Tax=Dyadobacter psychrotolerans TaxID=2541721 RepID=UPI0035B5D971
MKNVFKLFILAIIATAPVVGFAQQYKLPFKQAAWTKSYPPFRIAGDLYYVGTDDLASYLLTTKEGHILINTGLEESVGELKKNVEKLGFKFSDIKILLATHAHYDHVAAMAAIKKATGATLMIQQADVQFMKDGGKSDSVLGKDGATFAAVVPDRILKDQDIVKLGGASVKLLHHPGHTPGASSFSLTVKDQKRSYKVLIANIPTILDETKLSGMPGYVQVGKDYGYTISVMKKERFDIWLASHASQFSLQKKHQPGDPYRPEAFFGRQDYDKTLAEIEVNYNKRIKE